MTYSNEEIKRILKERSHSERVANNGNIHKLNGHDHSETDFPIVSPFPIDVSKIPMRPWLVPGLLLRKQLSVMVAPPGSGKSLLTLQVAIMCASAMPGWAGWRCPKQYRVLIINVEEDGDELRRRLFAAAQTMGVDASELSGLMFAETDEIVVAKIDPRTKTITTMPVYDQIIDSIKKNKIDLCIVDPFAETFAVDENSNSELKWAAMLWRKVARETGCSMFLIHHTKKYSANMAGDMDAGRGAGAVTGVARIMATLFGMTGEEASSMDIDDEERGRYVRFDDAKANLNLVSSKAKWFTKKTFVLPNGEDGADGDEVGVLVPWTPPSIFDGLDNDKIGNILDELEAGVRDDSGRPTGEWYCQSRKGGSRRWAGNLIIANTACTDGDAIKILKTWVKSNLIYEKEEYSEKHRKNKTRIFVNNENRPGRILEDVSIGD